jgi:hypothetical protein
MSSFLDEAEISPPVIPGAMRSIEPGIHRAAQQVDEWIPGPPLSLRPGMTDGATSRSQNAPSGATRAMLFGRRGNRPYPQQMEAIMRKHRDLENLPSFQRHA